MEEPAGEILPVADEPIDEPPATPTRCVAQHRWRAAWAPRTPRMAPPWQQTAIAIGLALLATAALIASRLPLRR